MPNGSLASHRPGMVLDLRLAMGEWLSAEGVSDAEFAEADSKSPELPSPETPDHNGRTVAHYMAALV